MADIKIQPLQSPFLKLAKDEQFFSLHRAALEWDIEEPIIIEKPDDVKSKATWHDLLNPFHHQVTNLITFCRRLPVTLLDIRTGVTSRLSSHPILDFYKKGLLVSVNTDDPKMFNTSLEGEFAALMSEAGFKPADIIKLL
jgi:hypothetical protein